MTINFLLNGDFEVGKYYPLVDERWPPGSDLRGPIPNINIPNGWEFWYALNGDDPKAQFYHAELGEKRLKPQDIAWGRPEVTTWKNDNFGTDFEHAWAWLDGGAWTFKVFGNYIPVWWRLHQNVSNLTPGQRYVLKVPMRMELILTYSPMVVMAGDTNSGQVRLSVGDTPGVITTGWQDGTIFPFRQWNVVEFEFTARSEIERVHIEFAGRWGLEDNKCVVDSVRLEQIEGALPPILIPPTPTTPTVLSLLDDIDYAVRLIRELL